MTDTVRRAGMLQIGCLVVFCAAGLMGVFAFLSERYGLAAINAVIMAVNFYLYQINSQIITKASKTY